MAELRARKPVGPQRGNPRGHLTVQLDPFVSCYVCFVADDDGVLAAMEEFPGMDKPDGMAWDDDVSALARTHRLESKQGGFATMVSIDMKQVLEAEEFKQYQAATVLAHEASHVADMLFEHVGEEYPGTETRAYMVQFIVETGVMFYHRRYPQLRK